MSESRVFSLEAIRTDGWFERLGESVGSFGTLCEILGETFFAFSLITGARIKTLNVDRRNPRSSVVEYEVGGSGGEPLRSQRLTLERFRQRLVAALVTKEELAPAPERDTDTEAIQMHVGVRYLLLAPLFGYALVTLRCRPGRSELVVSRDGREVELELDTFQELLRSHVLEELERVQTNVPDEPGRVDLADIGRARSAAEQGHHADVIKLLGGWAAPLSILLRTPDGRALDSETRSLLAEALGLLGRALAAADDAEQAEEVMRLAIQYAVDSPRAAAAYADLGRFLLEAKRPGEAIAPLRRAANLRAAPELIWPFLSLAFLERGRLLAAFAAADLGRVSGVDDPRLAAVQGQVRRRLPALEHWEALVPASTQRG